MHFTKCFLSEECRLLVYRSVIQRTTQRFIPEDGTLPNHRCEKLKSYIVLSFHIKVGETGKACSIHWIDKVPTIFSWRTWKKGIAAGDVLVNGRIMQKSILKKWDWGCGLHSLAQDRIQWSAHADTVMNSGFHGKDGGGGVGGTGQLFALQGVFSTEPVVFSVKL
jgi:hypothetical protein